MKGRSAVFLDRDGVLTELIRRDGRSVAPRQVYDFHMVEGLAEQLERLHQASFVLVVVTNQPDIARGHLSWTSLEAMHRRLTDETVIDHLAVCPHDGPDGCRCRKPKPGMLIEAGETLGLDLASSWLVGDRWVDILAGRSAGCKTILLEHAESWKPTSEGPVPCGLVPDVVVSSLERAVDAILEKVVQPLGGM